MPADDADRFLVSRIRGGAPDAWQELIDRYEGRLLAFAESRVNNRAAAEDIVQEAFLGFLTSLPNYDDTTPLESWLFTITAYKLTDYLRREGRRPKIPLVLSDSAGNATEPEAPSRKASSMARSQERKTTEENVIAACLADLIQSWRDKGEYERLQCIELLLVAGLPNKKVAKRLNLSEQTVANHKHFVVNKLKEAATRARVQDWDEARLGLA